MSRLYGRLQSDRRKTDATVGANESIECKLTWGSANNPITAVKVYLEWPKGSPGPKLTIDIPDDIEAIVYAEGGPQFVSEL